MSPGRLFRELRRRPRVGGAVALASALFLAAELVTLELDGPDSFADRRVVVFAMGLRLAAFWVWLKAAAFVGLAFGGFAASPVPYRAWLSLAAHCSLVAAVVVPVELAAGEVLGAPASALNLAAALAVSVSTPAGAWLEHVSPRTVAFLTLFSVGAASFTRASSWRAGLFIAGTWSVLWFLLAWFNAGVA